MTMEMKMKQKKKAKVSTIAHDIEYETDSYYGTDVRETMTHWRDAGVVPARDERKIEEMMTCIGNKRGWYRQAKELMAIDAAVLDTFYDKGPEKFSRAKDLYNKYTRRAASYYHLIEERTVPVRGLQSCGHDMFKGQLLTIRELEPRYSSANLKANTHWRPTNTSKTIRVIGNSKKSKEFLMKYIRQQIESWKAFVAEHNIPLIKADSWTNALNSDLLKDAPYGKEWVIKTEDDDGNKIYMPTRNGLLLKYMLNDPEQFNTEFWYNTLNYYMFHYESYKGKCAWEDDERHCLHHQGQINERALVYYADHEGNPIPMKVNWQQYGFGWEVERPVRYDCDDVEYDVQVLRLNDLEDPDELIKQCLDETVLLNSIRKAIQRSKTKTKKWLKSTWNAKVLNSDGTQAFEMEDYIDYKGQTKQRKKYLTKQMGTRGHYQLRWWDRIHKQRTQQERQSFINNLVLKHGSGAEPRNGWTFHGSGIGGSWRGSAPVYMITAITINTDGEIDYNKKTYDKYYLDKAQAFNIVSKLNDDIEGLITHNNPTVAGLVSCAPIYTVTERHVSIDLRYVTPWDAETYEQNDDTAHLKYKKPEDITPAQMLELWYNNAEWPYKEYGVSSWGNEHHTKSEEISDQLSDYTKAIARAQDVIAHIKAGETGTPEVNKND